MGDTGDVKQPWKPWDGIPKPAYEQLADINTPLMSDQEIRARALECTTRMWANASREVTGDPDIYMETLKSVFWADVKEFEDYIRNGK